MPEKLPRIFGDFALLHPLGQGATGDVHIARPLDPSRGMPAPLVIKRLHRKYLAHEEFIKRFRHEAEIAILVDSPHIAKVYAVGAAGETLFIAMEYVAGFPVANVLTELFDKRLRPAVPIAVELMLGGLAGLHALHTAQDRNGRPLSVVHRDISPKNLMAGTDGQIHLIDLGLGKSNAQDWKTETGTIMGSPGYMAPEQIRGLAVDARADVYAMGVVLFELITITRHIKRESIPKMLTSAVQQPIRPPSEFRKDVPPELDAVVVRALSKEPGERFASAEEMAIALSRAVPDRVDREDLVAFMHHAFGDQLEKQARLTEALMALPLPDPSQEPSELTDLFALRPTVSNVPSPILGPGAAPSVQALSEVPTVKGSKPYLTTTMAPPSLTPATDKDPKLGIRTVSLDPPTLLKTRAQDPPGTLHLTRRPVPLRTLSILTISLLVGAAVGAAIVGGGFEEAPGGAIVGDVPPPPKIAPPKVDPPRIDPQLAAPEREEAAESPPPKTTLKRRPKTPAGAAGEEAGTTIEPPKTEDPVEALSARAKTIEDRAVALKKRVASDEGKSNAVEKVLYDLSLVRASRNPQRALDQLTALEARLKDIESSR